MSGFSLIDLMCALGVAATLTTIAVPAVRAAVCEFRAAGAARHVAGQLQGARVRAIGRGRDTAVRVTRDARGYVLTLFEDGNRNGVLSRDIADGVDVPVGAVVRLHHEFPGVDLGTIPNLPGVEGGAPPGTDPVRIGASDSVTFTPDGTATPGSLYVKGEGGAQFVVRIYGETGRTRVLRYRPGVRTWESP